MTRVLFIAYFFPPMGGSGVQRSLKFVKYLPDFDINPIVLTVNSRFTRWPKDRTMLNEIPNTIMVYRTFTFDLNWLFKLLWGLKLNKVVEWLQLNWLIPDPEITWLPFAKKKIKQIVRKHKIDLIYITGGPFSSLLLGPYCNRNYNLPYIVDFRDEWTNNHSRLDRQYSKLFKKIESEQEREVLSLCSGIVYAHPKFMQENFENKYPFLKIKKYRIITNGYDEVDFNETGQSNPIQSELFRIVYSGSFYGRRQPSVLWEAISKLLSEGSIDKSKIIVEIHGKNTPSFVLGEHFHHQDIRSLVQFHPYCSHKESISLQRRAVLQLIYLAPGPNSEPELPGKLFECLRNGRPILAIVPSHGTAADIIRECNSGFVYDSAKPEEVRIGLLSLYEDWMNRTLFTSPVKECIARYERKTLTSKLAELMREIVQQNQEY